MDSRFGSSSRSRLVVLWLSGLFCLWQGWCSAQSIVLAWTPSMSPNIVGYNVYYGTVSGQYTNEIPVGDVTNVTVPGLAIGGTYYFAADAVNSSGLESPLSTQTSYSVPEPVLSLSITNLTSGMAVTNSTFTVMGLATDEVGVANVFYSLNGGAYSAVAPNGAQWSVVLRLAAGANVLAIYAVDTLGNISATDTVSIVYTPVATLAVTTKGEGSVSPNYNGAVLQVDRLYT
ncbi:MAG: fibronectin type III domain-containing protein, partial [Limisphaerales bacterium]